METYWKYIALAESIKTTMCLLDTLGDTKKADDLQKYFELVMKNTPNDEKYNPFGGPQMLPDNWRLIAHGTSDANGYNLIEICKQLKPKSKKKTILPTFG